MVDGHGCERTGLGVRPHVAVSAQEDTSHLLSAPLNLNSCKTSDPIAVLANVDPKQEFHGPSVSRKKRSGVRVTMRSSALQSTRSAYGRTVRPPPRTPSGTLLLRPSGLSSRH